jgi:hypothetical protein
MDARQLHQTIQKRIVVEKILTETVPEMDGTTARGGYWVFAHD